MAQGDVLKWDAICELTFYQISLKLNIDAENSAYTKRYQKIKWKQNSKK